MPILNDDTTQLTPGRPTEEFSFSPSGTGGLKDSLDGLQARLAIPSRYEVLAELGRGGMGIVYKVRDIETCEVMALKILKPEIAADPAMRESLRKEVCLARKVTHKNVCRIHEFTRTETTACISMEYVDGESLLSKMQRRGALSAVDAVEIARQICAGLSEAHAQGIVHRDLKPANIVVGHDKVVKIMDFGIARLSRDTADTTGGLAGTPAYMAPEQLEVQAVTARTDIYSFGLVLFEMMTGEPAFKGESAIALALQQIRQTPQRPSAVMPTISARLDSTILKCLEKDPAKRFASVDELGTALEKAMLPVSTPSKPIVNWEPAKYAATQIGRAALADLMLLGNKIETGARQLKQTTKPMLQEWIAQIRKQDWRTKPSPKMQAAMFAGTLFAAALVFGLAMRQPTHAAQRTQPSQLLASTLNQPAAPVVAASAQPASPFDAKEFEFDQAAPADETDTASARADDSAKQSVTSGMAAEPVHTSSGIVKKRPQVVALRSNTQPNASQAVVAAAPNANPAPTVTADALTIPMDRDVSTELLAPEPAVPVTPTPQSNPPTEAKADADAIYLEVGSFNDANWADDAVKQLSQLGFSAMSVHKAHLWVQSYHIEVGPFKTPAEMDAAEKQLSAKGFKSHAVK